MSISTTPTYQFSCEVLPQYLPEQSSPADQQFSFSYTITVTNTGDVAAQLISRHWFISDAKGHNEEVKGLGVVGHQPLLKPGESFQYTSGSRLRTATGAMHGLRPRPTLPVGYCTEVKAATDYADALRLTGRFAGAARPRRALGRASRLADSLVRVAARRRSLGIGRPGPTAAVHDGCRSRSCFAKPLAVLVAPVYANAGHHDPACRFWLCAQDCFRQ